MPRAGGWPPASSTPISTIATAGFGVTEFAEAMLRHGSTAFTDGFYGPGIVAGPDAVRFMKDAFDPLPIRLLVLAPTRAYTQNRELGLIPAAGVSTEELRPGPARHRSSFRTKLPTPPAVRSVRDCAKPNTWT